MLPISSPDNREAILILWAGPLYSHEPLKAEGAGRRVGQRDVVEEESLGEMKQKGGHRDLKQEKDQTLHCCLKKEEGGHEPRSAGGLQRKQRPPSYSPMELSPAAT